MPVARQVGLGERHDLIVAEGFEAAPDLGQRLVFALEALDETQASEVLVAVLGAGAGGADRRQQPLGQVVADRARRDAGQVGQLGHGVAGVVRIGGCHAAILNSATSHCQYLS
jgi:hypothetical protein